MHRDNRRRGGWGRRHRGRDRDQGQYYIPDWRNNWGECRDPGSFDRNYLDDERAMGFDQPESFYSMDPWPQGVVNDDSDSNYGSDALDPNGYDAPAPNQPIADPGPYYRSAPPVATVQAPPPEDEAPPPDEEQPPQR